MGQLSDDVLNLRRDMHNLSGERKSLISSLKVNHAERQLAVRQLINDFRQDRLKKIAPFINKLKESRKQTVDIKQQLQVNTTRMLEDLRHERNKNAKQQYADRKDSVSKILATVSTQLTDWKHEQGKKSTEVSKDLNTFRADLIATMDEFAVNIAAARGLRNHALENMRQEVRQQRNKSQQQLASEAEAAREIRQYAIKNIRNGVSGIMQSAQSRRQAVISELEAIRQAWQGQSASPPTVVKALLQPVKEDVEKIAPVNLEQDKDLSLPAMRVDWPAE